MTNKSFVHNNIARSESKIWKKSFINTVAKECAAAGYDVIKTPETVIIGLVETDQIFLRAIKGHGAWLTRYDRKLFDENAV
jgi:hypothetical protein